MPRPQQVQRKIGFDSIFLHFGHGWLPAQFLSPHYNHRTDSYGGSIENRSRFPLRILETVRKAVGKDYPIDMRVSAYEWIEDSISFEDVMYFLKQAEQYVDTVQISSGIDKVFEANCIASQPIWKKKCRISNGQKLQSRSLRFRFLWSAPL